MSKKKSNPKKTNSKKTVNKGVKSKGRVNTPKKAKKSVNKSKKTQIKKAKQILSQQTWRNTKDSSGKIKKGRRKSIKLITQGDTNRYQTIIKTISDYYKKAGTPLKRKDLYKEYRRIRDNFSNVPLSVLIPQFDRLVIKGKGKRLFPNELKLGIPWFQFEDEMTANYSQRYFKLNDTIILDLSCLRPKVPNMRFPYSKIIGNYKKLYNNITFRTQVKKQSPVSEFEYDPSRSNPNKGIYVFVLVDCPPVVGPPSRQPSKKTPTTPTPTPFNTGPLGAILGTDINIIKEQNKLEKQKEINKLREKENLLTQAFADKQMTYTQYNIEMENIREDIEELKNEIKNM